MPFEAVTNLATAQAADEERKRRREQAQLAADEEALKREVLARKAEDAAGPAGVLDDLLGAGGRRAAVSGDVLQSAEEDRFLNQQAQRRFERRGAELDRKQTALAVPGKTAAERQAEMLAPLGSFATEDPSARAQELLRDPRGRLARLEAQRDRIAGPDVSRETPIYTDAPRAHGSRRTEPGITVGGEGPATMPYAGALDALFGMDVPRAGIRKEFGGTADDRTLSFSDRPEAGMRRYNSNRGTTKDVGAPGGGLVSAGGKNNPAQDALLGGLDELIGEAKRQPFTPEERAKDIAVQQPGWDVMASRTTPEEIATQINTAVGEGRLNPATGQNLLRRYASIADEAYDSDGVFDPDKWVGRLGQDRKPAPGEAEARAKTGGTQLPQAQAAQAAAVADATTPPPGGPGQQRSPALAAESAPAGSQEGFFSALAAGARRGATDRLTGGGVTLPPTPAGAPGPGDILRVVAPAAAAGFTGGASIPLAAATGFGTGAGSELLAELFNGEPVDPTRIGATGLVDAAGGALVPPVTRALGRGFNAVQSLSRRFRPGAIPGVYGPSWEAGAPTRVLGGLTEDLGAPGTATRVADDALTTGRASTLERARQASAEAGAAAPPSGPVPYLEDRLPALRGGGYDLGPATDEPLDIEQLIAEYLQRSRRALPPPAAPAGPPNLPALRGGGFVLR